MCTAAQMTKAFNGNARKVIIFLSIKCQCLSAVLCSLATILFFFDNEKDFFKEKINECVTAYG